MGLGKAIFRFREERAQIPAYQRDRAEFAFSRRDRDSWVRAFDAAKVQLHDFMLKRSSEP